VNNKEGHLQRDRLRHSAKLIVAGAVLSLLAFGASSAFATTAVKGSSGSFTFSGSVSGTLKVPALFMPGSALTGCTTTFVGTPSHPGGTDTITWTNVTLKVAGKSTKLANVSLAINTGSFGRTQTMKPALSSASTSVTFNTTYAYAWQNKSGTASTAKNGSSGTLKGVLAGTAGHPGTVTIKGKWAGCTKSNI
jgi:hypothetical protein